MIILNIPFATPEYDELVQLRLDVLRKPLGIDFTTEFLEKEWKDIHLAIYDDAYNLLGGLLLTHISDTTVQMRQVAIAQNKQNAGIGKYLVAYAEQYAQEKGYQMMYLHAREVVLPFYTKQGYTYIGEPFVEVGIPHQAMQKTLSHF